MVRKSDLLYVSPGVSDRFEYARDKFSLLKGEIYDYFAWQYGPISFEELVSYFRQYYVVVHPSDLRTYVDELLIEGFLSVE